MWPFTKMKSRREKIQEKTERDARRSKDEKRLIEIAVDYYAGPDVNAVALERIQSARGRCEVALTIWVKEKAETGIMYKGFDYYNSVMAKFFRKALEPVEDLAALEDLLARMYKEDGSALFRYHVEHGFFGEKATIPNRQITWLYEEKIRPLRAKQNPPAGGV